MGLRVCLDARLLSGTSGGVEQVVIGLAEGLAQLNDGDEEYVFLAYADSTDWLRPHLAGPCRFLIDETREQHPDPLPWKRLAKRIPAARYVRNNLPQIGPLRPKIPRSSGLIEHEGVDVMHFTTQRGFFTQIPSVYHPHDLQHLHMPEYFSRRARAEREATYRALCWQADMVAVASEWVKQDLIQNYELQGDKVRVIPLAPPLQAYPEPSQAEMLRTHSKYGLPDTFLYYPAQTWPHKNHVPLLRALALLRDRDGLRLPLVCSGQTTSYLRRILSEARKLRLNDVTFLGFVTPLELQCLYRLCRGVVIPTLFEAGSFPMMEAFSVGAPVACSNVTSLPEQAGDAALVFDPTDPWQMADAIRRLWTDPELRTTLVGRARGRIRSARWTDTARVFRAHYRRLAGREPTEADLDLLSRPSDRRC